MPVELVERGGRRVERVEVLRRDGSSGSIEIAPSFCRSRILTSRRRICRSSYQPSSQRLKIKAEFHKPKALRKQIAIAKSCR